MDCCYTKTAAGQEEIREGRRKLSQAARTLLLIIDDRHSGTGWLQLVHGAAASDLALLVHQGLVAAQLHDPATRQNLPSNPTLAEALARLSFDQLYDLMTSQARERLGLIRGFQFVLTIERCRSHAELCNLALEFVKLIQEHRGEAAARQMRLAFGAPAA